MQGEEGLIVGALHDVVIRMLESGGHTDQERERDNAKLVYESLVSRLKACREAPPPWLPLTTVDVTVESITTDASRKRRKKVAHNEKKTVAKRRVGDKGADGSTDSSTYPFKTVDECKSSASTRSTYMSKENLVRRIEAHEPSRRLMPVHFMRLKKSAICEALMASGR